MTEVRTDTPIRAFVLQPGTVLTVSADAVSNGRVGRLANNDGEAVPDQASAFAAVAAGATKSFGPFPYRTRHSIEALVGRVAYTVEQSAFGYDQLLGVIRGFTGNRTLASEDNGRILRCDDPSNVVVTVPNNLPEGFSCGFVMWSTGTVTIAPASGATNRSGKTALTTQYQSGDMLVMKQTANAAAEFITAGDFL